MKNYLGMSHGHVSWIDAYKGVLIVLVVLGHVIGGAVHIMPEEMGSRNVAEYAFKFIYSFHMPAFFFIAGVTFGMGRKKAYSEFVLRKVRRLLVPYFLFGIVSALLYLVMSGNFNSSVTNHATDTYYAGKTGIAWWMPFLGLLHGGGWPNGQGFIANSVLWFLPCMFTVEMAYYLLDRAVPCRCHQLVAGSLLLLLAYPLKCLLPPMLPLGLSKLPYYLPFMILGRWLPSKVRTNRFAPTLGVTLFIALAVGVIVTPNAWYATQSWKWSLVFIGLAVLGSLMPICLIDLLDWRFVRASGTASMTIMLLHKFLVVAMQLKIPVFREMSAFGGWRMIAATMAITVVSVITCVAADSLILSLAPWMLGAVSSVKSNGAAKRNT